MYYAILESSTTQHQHFSDSTARHQIIRYNTSQCHTDRCQYSMSCNRQIEVRFRQFHVRAAACGDPVCQLL